MITIYFLALFWASCSFAAYEDNPGIDARHEIHKEKAYRVRTFQPGMRGFATAFSVGAHQLITAGHVTKDAVAITVEVGGDWLACKIERVDKEMDLALLNCEATFEPMQMGGDNPECGGIWGSPDGRAIAAIAFVAGPKIPTPQGLECVCCNKAFAPGCSGAPLVTLDGKCAGLAIGYADVKRLRFGAYVPSRCIVKFLADAPQR